MTYPFSKIFNEAPICEKFLTRFLYKEKQDSASSPAIRKKERATRSILSSQQDLIKVGSNAKQQNMSFANKQKNALHTKDSCVDHYIGDNMMNTVNRGPRSTSSTVDRETWDQALKKQKSGDKISIFGNFDPLRTLHFLAKELQVQIHTVLPEDNMIQQIVKDMQYALKRIPPEIASTIHLQQDVDLQTKSSMSRINMLKPEKLSVQTIDSAVQTVPHKCIENNDKLQQIMEKGTLKLEKSCKFMEKLCIDLKNEKTKLEGDLAESALNNKALRNKISELELENKEILTPRLKVLEDDKHKLQTQLKSMTSKLETVSGHASNDLKSQITELKSQKSGLEQECNNLKHKIKVFALEREKFVAILDLRDSQINEIRLEMNQLQDVINEQLLELQNNAYALANMKKTGNNIEILTLDHLTQKNYQLASDGTISSIKEQDYSTCDQNKNFQDL